MEAIILEPKNKDELNAVKKTLKKMGIKSYSVSDSDKKFLSGLQLIEDFSIEKLPEEKRKQLNKEERNQIARYNLATLAKQNPKATASMKLINKVLHDIRNPNNAKKKR